MIPTIDVSWETMISVVSCIHLLRKGMSTQLAMEVRTARKIVMLAYCARVNPYWIFQKRKKTVSGPRLKNCMRQRTPTIVTIHTCEPSSRVRNKLLKIPKTFLMKPILKTGTKVKNGNARYFTHFFLFLLSLFVLSP